MRTLAVNKHARKSELIKIIQNSLQEFLEKNKSKKRQIKVMLQKVRGINFETNFEISFEYGKNNELEISELFYKISRWAEDNDETVLIAIDKAQEFRKMTNFNMTGLLSSIYDNCYRIIIVLTGSESGLLYEFMGVGDPKAALFGRSFEEIKLLSLSKEKSIEFFNAGFAQYKLGIKESKVNNIINLAAEELGGIPGWLIKFGTKYVQQKKGNTFNIKKSTE